VHTPNQWLLTNGIGGYAMGSLQWGGTPAELLLTHTHRYHGMLIAAASPPVQRLLALHSIVQRFTNATGTHRYNDYDFANADGTLHEPDWWHCPGLERFTIDLPHTLQWDFWLDQHTLIQRSLTLAADCNAATVSWTLGRADPPAPVTLHARPLTPLRDFHALQHQTDSPPHLEQIDSQTITLSRNGHTLELQLSRGQWQIDPQWWNNFFYKRDQQRGQDYIEDLWSPGQFDIELTAEPFTLKASLIEPHHRIASSTPITPRQRSKPRTTKQTLQQAVDQFYVQRRVDANTTSGSIIAGYPWFADWGRDSMIVIAGLLHCDNGMTRARSILHTFANRLKRGLIPNRFDDYSNLTHTNTVDASLWFIRSVFLYIQAISDRSQGDRELIDCCCAIINAYQRGTDHGIRMDDDGLITAGSPHTQLTWMDAQRDGVIFTPRHGKAIEINALWHHALVCVAAMIDDETQQHTLRDLASRVATSIRQQFWNAQQQCCYDVLAQCDAGEVLDDAIRPNQLFAVSLTPSPLTLDQQHSVLQIIEQHLLTPYGLRTLQPGHPQFHSRYAGTLTERDAAYHQGTVWPWLMGAYVEAYLRLHDHRPQAISAMEAAIQPLIDSLDSGCFGHIAEVYDGLAPHHPDGCPAQAWSASELLRAYTLIHG
jgi:glycogen debranching enzyme